MKITIYIVILIFHLISKAENVEIESMLTEHQKNQARFYSKYKNKKIASKGIVKSITAETTIERSQNALLKLPPVFLIFINDSGSKVSCFIKDEKVATNLNINDSINYAGVINDITYSGDGIIVTNCKIKINN